MEYRFSKSVDPSTYETYGLCNGVTLRKHQDPDKENKGALRAQSDWSKLVSSVGFYKGGLGPEFNFMQVTVPECRPERLEIISYANEFAFLYDDAMETIEEEPQKTGPSRQMLEVFSNGSRDADLEVESSGEKQIQSQILLEMMAIDPERAITSMKSWAKFIQLAASRPRSMPFANLEEYLPYRITDAGELFWFGMVTFGMALTIPEHEIDLCKELVRPAFAAISLTNDLFSWEKERDAAERHCYPHVVNAIWVLMREHSITELEAQALCRQKIRENVEKSVGVGRATREDFAISLDLRKYVEAIQFSLSGNLVWSIYCPRYHPEAWYNDEQCSMMEKMTTSQPLSTTTIEI